MRCSKCQTENREGRRFCSECGASLNLACPSCGFSNEPGEKFCGGCGQLLASREQVAPKFSSPKTYTPKHLAEKILTSKSALEGERKQVTVLFADMKGSMELLADRDPEEARKLFDAVIEHMMEAVHRYEGTVNHILGDGIMALFGAPLAHEDHAVRACYAALRMQESVKRYAADVQRTQGVPIQIRVGLNTGDVVVGAIRNDLHMDYTAIGQTVHLASRMEQMAKPGSILMTPHTLRLAEGYVQVKSLGPVSVKGLNEPVEVYEITGAGPVRSRLQASAARGLTRFVGRSAEFETLCQALERAGAGRGQVVALVGEPGVGKSRLFWEFTHSRRIVDWLILESGSVSYGKATPYLPLIDLLKAYFKITDRDDQREIREKVTGKLLTLDKSLESTLPAFLALLDVPVDDPMWQALDPSQRRQQTLGAVKRLLLRESQVQPLILLFEDLHWIDSETQAMLESLVESLPTSRLLLLVNYRPEYQHGWANRTYYTQLRLDPLPPESAGEILNSVLGNDHGLQSLKQLLIERTEGNPFFLEESIRTLVETKVLAGERGNYHLEKKVESTQVPATVQAVLAARIDRLPLEEKQLLQSAAVIGKDVPFSLLQAIAELSDEELRRGLTRLQAAEFLYETSLFPDLEYTFKHALTHEIAYASLLKDRRRVLHARITETIERLYPDRLSEQVEQLAHHSFRGKLWEKAVGYLGQAGKKAEDHSAHPQAVAYFEQALSALENVSDGRRKIEEAIDLRFELRNSLLPLGALDQILHYLREAESLAKSLDDPRRLAQVSCYMTQYYWVTRNHKDAISVGQRALTIAAALMDLAVQVETNFYLGAAYYNLGEYRQAAHCLKGNIEALQGDLIYERFGMPFLPSVTSRTWLVWSLAELGLFNDAIGAAEAALRIAEAVNHPFSLIDGYLAVGVLRLNKGEIQKAIRLLEKALEISKVWDIPLLFPWIAPPLGLAYAITGKLGDAIPLLEHAVDQANTIRLMTNQARRLVMLGEAYLLAGRLDDSRTCSERAFDLSFGHNERGQQAYTFWLLGQIASRREPPQEEEAEEHYRQAISMADQLGMRPLLAHCHAGFGELYRRTGKREKSKMHLTNAVPMMREMEMGLWLERAETELKELG